ncbi:hypothetical protein [Brucella sp. 2280]|uniref:hypothetical protein n=1 Tax=Brucella sp. 2280 TaxID=2592625 RepID=UPI0012967C21|nr:hypothetical protein [Brucella sp. 2280]QGA57266.1 hypothetical protein GHC20_09335 [Brucella sp. 2280]
MADNEERLVVLLEARVNELEKGMKKAQGVANAAYREMKKNSRSATRQMEQDAARSASRINQAFATIGTKVGDYSKAFAGGLWAGVAAGGLTGVAAAVRNVASSFAQLSYEAKTAGVSVEDFQRWRYVADQNKIGVDALIDGFKELNLRADEYIQTGKGSAAESFQRLGMSPAEVKERIKDPSKFMLELIDRTRRLKDTAAGVRIFDELLGGSGGEQFVRLIEQGREGISATIKEADTMGAVMDENFIRKAEEVDKKFNQIANTIGSTLKTAIVDAVGALSAFISSWNELNEKSTSGIRAELDILQKQKERWESQPAGDWQDSVAGVFGKDRESQLAAITTRQKELNDELERRKNLNVPVIPDAPPVAPYVPPSDPKKQGRSAADKSRDKAIRDAERERKAVEDLIAQLQFEASLVGKTAVEKQKMIALRQAGAAATETEKQKIEALVESTYKQNEAWQKSQDQLAELNDMGREFAGTLVSGLLNGAKASDVLADALGRLADRFLNSGLDALFGGGGGGIGSLFGSILGGGSGFGLGYFPPVPKMYARGSTFTPGGDAIVGEQGPELVRLPRGSKVTPNHMLGKEGSGGRDQNVHVTSDVRVSIDKDGNLEAFVTSHSANAASKVLDKYRQSQAFLYDVGRAVPDARNRRFFR